MGSLLSLLLFLLLTIFLALKNIKFLLSPQIGYLLGFILQAVFCLFYIDQWNIKLHPRTILTISWGRDFVLGSFRLRYRYKQKNFYK